MLWGQPSTYGEGFDLCSSKVKNIFPLILVCKSNFSTQPTHFCIKFLFLTLPYNFVDARLPGIFISFHLPMGTVCNRGKKIVSKGGSNKILCRWGFELWAPFSPTPAHVSSCSTSVPAIFYVCSSQFFFYTCHK